MRTDFVLDAVGEKLGIQLTNEQFAAYMNNFAANRRMNREQGMTVILITHYMDEAAGCDRVVVMDGGSIIMDGTPEKVFSQVEKLKEAGLDVPQVTELAYELRKAGYDIYYIGSYNGIEKK